MDFLHLIKVIELNRLSFFTTKELADILQVPPKSIQNYLETLANNELVIRIEKGKYCRAYLSDPRIIGSNMVHGGILSHKSALSYHQLAVDDPVNVYISSGHQKKNKTFKGTYYRFIKIRSHKYFGFYEQSTQDGIIRVTDREKTLLDCLDRPQYSTNYFNTLSLLSNEHIDPDKLLSYGIRMQNLSILKRVAFLSAEMNLTAYEHFRDKVKTLVNEKYTLLDPTGPESGPFSSKWRIRNNVIQSIPAS